jgi:hypothetical protein
MTTVYIVKDLVPDLTQFYKQYKSIQPWLQSNNPPAQGELTFISFTSPLLVCWGDCVCCSKSGFASFGMPEYPPLLCSGQLAFDSLPALYSID